MKILRLFPFIAILLSLTLTSCNEDIDFTGDYKKTAVIYGLLNQADSVHYIKITRAFGGANNSLEVAQIEDSSYFPVLSATIQEVINGSVVRTWNLQDTVLTGKIPGIFYSPNQKVYYFKTTSANPLQATATYKLDVNVNNDEFHVYGETQMIQNLAITSPSGLASLSFASSNVPANGYKSGKITVNPGLAPRDSKVLDCRMEIFFNEYFNGIPVEKSFVWKLGELNGADVGDQPIFLGSGQVFYELIKANVTSDPTITKREFTRLKIFVTGGTDDLSKYLLVNKPSSGLAQNKPTFTNLTATNDAQVIGLFSSRHTLILEKAKFINSGVYPRAIDANSIKELCTGAITGGLLFCSDHPNDASESYFCN